VFERSKIPLHKWLLAIFLLCSSKKGMSAHQLHRTMKITYKTAWFMAHRIREAMRSGGLAPPMGGSGSIVEADETYISTSAEGRFLKSKGVKRLGRGGAYKRTVLTLVDRTGEARSFHIDRASARNILPIIDANLDKEAMIATDDAPYYRSLTRRGRRHASVNHSDHEYARGIVHTNTVEGYFSIFKRGMKGVYQHCSEQHLHRYLAEFDFRYSNRSALGIEDAERARKALRGAAGKRLTYGATRATGRAPA
jgi:hypothetical protein